MPKEIRGSLTEGMSADDICCALTGYLINGRPTEQDVKSCTDYIRKIVPTRVFYKALEEVYARLEQDGSVQSDRYSEYLSLLYGHRMKDSLKCCGPENANMTVTGTYGKDRVDELVNLGSVVDFALNCCDQYDEVRTIYYMLLEMMDGTKDPEWLKAKKDLKARMKKLSSVVTIEHADEFVAEKNVSYEVGYVERGGTGVEIK